MSRIDEALSKGLPDSVPPSPDATEENPWELSEQPRPLSPAAQRDVPAPTLPAGVEASNEEAPATLSAGAQMPDIVRRLGSDEAGQKVVGGSLPANVVEEYRRLAAFLHHTQLDRGSQVLMVTSAMAGEGKTLTATNLALTLSGSYGRSVLLVDADLRRPSLHSMFNVGNVSGLNDLLNHSTASPALLSISSRLTLLTAGRPDPDPMAALTSARMKQLIAEARAGFDWVIIDTPPVGLLTDASLLAQMVDLSLLVVRAESTPYEHVQRAAEAIGRHRVTGVVLNRVSRTALAEASRYDEYYSSYTKPRED